MCSPSRSLIIWPTSGMVAIASRARISRRITTAKIRPINWSNILLETQLDRLSCYLTADWIICLVNRCFYLYSQFVLLYLTSLSLSRSLFRFASLSCNLSENKDIIPLDCLHFLSTSEFFLSIYLYTYVCVFRSRSH